ncbi:MAG TPA: hypothetical protein VKZ79_24555 [Alphaproteobacteria bacterium]|nr:hypothetical protein [Alphaproteobacteria bacterium]
MADTGSKPIACTLLPNAFKDRAGKIQELTSRFLRRHRREEFSLRLSYDIAASSHVRELVVAEQACCSFLRFELQEDPDAIHLMITAPENARDAVDALFALFLPADARAASCHGR